MSDFIHLLPDSVANQIAAGEVIQRPASVVKELVENAIDAGASTVHILLTDAGRTCIQVIDDGKGMSETDARMAFERHATSKITQAADLFSLGTFGFRGEALPSIAAVAQVELHSRTADDELGTVLYIEGSKVIRQEVEVCAKGCNFLVKNLFFNVPARRKFLKSDQTELSNIMAEVERVALVNPEVAFILQHNGSELMNCPQASLRQRILHIFGKKMNQDLLSIDVETSIVHLTGFVGTPESAKKKGCHQFFFVNGRFMRHPYFHKAVMDAFAQLIPDNEQVSYFIYFQVDPSRIDVNIHPTKTEIKFEDDHAIWQILAASIREVLGRSHAVPTIDFDTADRPDIPIIPKDKHITPPRPSIDPDYNPFKSNREVPMQKAPIDWERLYGKTSGSDWGAPPDDATFKPASIDFGEIQPDDERAASFADPEKAQTLFNESDRGKEQKLECTQFNGQYIVTSVNSGLMLIEQHRAHTRILYDKYIKQLENKRGASQGMLFPELLQVSPSEAVRMDQLLNDFAYLGFDINNLGGGTFSIQGVPVGTEGLNPCELIRNMLISAIERNSTVRTDIHDTLALTMARSAAIIDGQVLTADEMNAIVSDLLTCSMPNYTPDGKKIICIIDEHEIEKLFN